MIAIHYTAVFTHNTGQINTKTYHLFFYFFYLISSTCRLVILSGINMEYSSSISGRGKLLSFIFRDSFTDFAEYDICKRSGRRAIIIVSNIVRSLYSPDCKLRVKSFYGCLFNNIAGHVDVLHRLRRRETPIPIIIITVSMATADWSGRCRIRKIMIIFYTGRLPESYTQFILNPVIVYIYILIYNVKNIIIKNR